MTRTGLTLWALIALAGCNESALGPPRQITATEVNGVKFGPARGLTPMLVGMVPNPAEGQIKFGTVGVSGNQVMVMSRSRGVAEGSARAQLVQACLKSARNAQVISAERRSQGGELQLFVDCRS